MGAGGLSLAFLSEITDPVETFAIVMCILLIAPLIFERFKIPGMIGLITAGIVVGPHGLGLLGMGEIFTLFRNVGLVYLMFLAGLEINLRQFGRQRNASMIFGSFTFFIPQVGGALLARWIFDFSWPTSILLASMFASHTLVPFPIVQKLGLSKNRAVTTTVGGTILTDTAAMLVLAVVAKSTEGDLSSLFFLRMGGLLGVFVAVTLIGLPRLGQWFFREVEPDGPIEFAFVLAACFVVSAAAHWAGVEPIIGAFLAGLALSAYVPENSVLMSRLQFTGHALFIPFFLLAVGMLVDLSVLFTGLKGWAVAIFMSVTVTATKWAAARISAKLLKMTRDEAGLIFSLSVNQAAATLAAVLVGHRLELFGDDVLNGTILMILVTCMIGPWLTDRYGRRISLRQPLEAEEPEKETPARILLPMDYERSASPLMDFALLLRAQEGHEPLYPLNVANEDSESRVAAAERILAPAVLRAVSADVPVQAVTRIDANTASGILRAVRELRISTVIMGWSGQSAARNLVFHSVPDHVIEQSHQTVFMCRLTGALNTVHRVVVLAPPLIERQPGLPELLRSIRHMAGQISARVLLVAGSATLRHLKPRFKERPRVDLETLEIVEWQGLVSGLRLIVQPEDGLLLLSVRRARLAWQPSLERLPRELAGAFPKNNLVVAYAAEPDIGGLPAVASSESETEPMPLTPGVRVVGLAAAQTEPDLPVRLRSLVAKRFGDGDPTEHVVQEILKIDPVELAPGAALLHAHIPDIAASEVHIGAGRKGIPVSGVDQPVRVVFVLLSGTEQPVSAHLRALAGVAALARMPKIVDRLAEAETEEQARAVLTDPGENAGA